MKVKNGNVSFGAKDTRIGNFVLTDQPDYWMISDMNARFSVRVHKTTLVGRALTYTKKGKAGGNYLKNLATVLFEVVLTVHDPESMNELMRVCREAVSRHPDFYGGDNEPSTDEKDRKALADAGAWESLARRGKDED